VINYEPIINLKTAKALAAWSSRAPTR